MKITVHKCPWSGKLFEDRKKYAKHLKVLRKEQAERREYARVAATFDQWIAPLYQLQTTDEIADWLTENFHIVAKHYGKGEKWGRKIKVKPDTGYKFKISNCKVKNDYATTHTAPLGEKTSGWGQETKYEPAWVGRISVTFTGSGYELFNTDFLRAIGVNSGSGGGGETGLAYEVNFYIKDFKGLRYMAQKSLLAVKSNRPPLDSNGNEIIQPTGRRPLFDNW